MRRKLTLIIVIPMLTGCAGGIHYPTCDRPLTVEETAHVQALADVIEVAGPHWQSNAETLRTLLKWRRVCVGNLPGDKDGWATWRPCKSSIILRPGFFGPSLLDIGRAFVLVIETCRVKAESAGGCDQVAIQWERDYLEVIRR